MIKNNLKFNYWCSILEKQLKEMGRSNLFGELTDRRKDWGNGLTPSDCIEKLLKDSKR